ncbi:MAG: 4Fe-4S binding protein [Desulfatiglans sp.]|nr:4Fe-4S binding protein [Thermodesulfobacteriota bacterium]MEE4351664.1 4Fe-4S binding protein [Desulfatiglans sp.]
MPRGKIEIIEEFCKGCQLCVHFCSKECIEISRDRFSPNGFLLPEFVNEEACIGCGICGWMCPECTIDVYRYVED